jgi:hypothetical protein
MRKQKIGLTNITKFTMSENKDIILYYFYHVHTIPPYGSNCHVSHRPWLLIVTHIFNDYIIKYRKIVALQGNNTRNFVI